MVGDHNSTKCNRTQDQWLLSANQNHAETMCHTDHVYFTEEKLPVKPRGYPVLSRHSTFYFFPYCLCPPTNYSGTNILIRSEIRTVSLWRSHHLSTTGLLAFYFLNFPFDLIAGHRAALSTSAFGLLHADGKLCVYFKNHFATLRIPALNPASGCPATLTGTLFSGAETRGCRKQTRPLESIISLVPKLTPAI